MNETFLLIDDRSVRDVNAAIITVMEFEQPHEVVVRDLKKSRTLKQNKLMWKWLTFLGKQWGDTKDYYHLYYKDKFLVSIYERDNPEYSQMISNIRDVYRSGMRTKAVELRNQIVKLTSTRDASTKQMAEYLTNIDHDAQEQGVVLERPDDIKLLQYENYKECQQG